MKTIVNESTFERMLKHVMRTLIVCGAITLAVAYFMFFVESQQVVYAAPKVVKSPIRVATSSPQFTIASTTKRIKIAFIGDQGNTNDTKRALTMVRDEKANALIVVGDFDYQDNPSLWKSNFDIYLGDKFPVIAVAGNHEEKAWDSGYKDVVRKQIELLPKGTCTSSVPENLGLYFDCVLGPVHFVFATPDIRIAQAEKTKKPEDFLKKQLKQSKSPWNICAWHKVHEGMQLGDKKDKISWDIYEACRASGAYIVSGHDHVYARSRTMFDFPKRIFATSTVDIVQVVPGKTGAVIVGLGGKDIRPRAPSQLVTPWWARVYTADILKAETEGQRTNIAGVLFCTFERDKKSAPCYFKMTDGKIKDEFTLMR